MIRKSLFVSLVLMGIVFFQPISMAAENDSKVDNLITNYVNNAYLASTLVNTAGQYVWDRKYDGAEKLYRAVIEIHPNNPYTIKAQVGLARLDVLNLIAEKKWSLAQQQVELMAADFNNEPDLAVSLFHIGKEYTWQHRYSEAKETFGLLLKQPLNNSFSQEAKLWFARAEVCSLIGQAKDEEVVTSTDKLISDFEGAAGLPEAIYWISKEYEWEKSAGENRTGWYDAPNSIFQRLTQQFGNSSFGIDAEWDQKRLTHRMKIFKLMQEPNQSNTDAAIEAMIADLIDRPEISTELLWIAWGYEEQPGKDAQANKLYKRIITEYPESDEVKDAYYCSGVFYSRSKEYSKAIERYQAVVANWPNYRFAWNAWFMIGHHYQQLAETGDVPQSVADAETKAAYQQITNAFSDCPVNGLVNSWLERHKED